MIKQGREFAQIYSAVTRHTLTCIVHCRTFSSIFITPGTGIFQDGLLDRRDGLGFHSAPTRIECSRTGRNWKTDSLPIIDEFNLIAPLMYIQIILALTASRLYLTLLQDYHIP